MKTKEKTRFDARLTPEQKELFEYAASLTGSRSLTHFIIDAAQKAAHQVIQKNQFMLISTKRDQKVFFHALVSPPKPNQKLTKPQRGIKNLWTVMKEIIEPLHSTHRKSEFCCGNTILDRYFHTKAGQDVKKQVCTCFVLAGPDQQVKGYYTLSSAALSRESLPDDLQKKLPLYRDIPVTLLGRLAIDKTFHKQGLGEFLLVDALRRSFEASRTVIDSVAVIVDPVDEATVRFYTKYGFIRLPDSGKMFLPMKTVAALF